MILKTITRTRTLKDGGFGLTNLKIGLWICGRGLGVMTIMPSGYRIKVVYEALCMNCGPIGTLNLDS